MLVFPESFPTQVTSQILDILLDSDDKLQEAFSKTLSFSPPVVLSFLHAPTSPSISFYESTYYT